MKWITKRLTVLILMTIFISSSVEAASFNIQQLERLAEQFAKEQVSVPANGRVEVIVSKQDSRTQIPDCEQPLNISRTHPNKPGKNINVKIICADTPPWRQYIPVRIKYLSPVFTAKIQLEKGTTIDKNKITLKYIDALYLRGSYFTLDEQLIGAKVKNRITSGSPISSKQICVVCKGELITLTVKSAGLKLKTEGIALTNGTLGEQIKVKNKRSNRIVFGRVSSVGNVQINL